MTDIYPSDIVTLLSGGTPMRVLSVRDDGRVMASWDQGREVGAFDVATLRRIERPDLGDRQQIGWLSRRHTTD